MLPTYGPGWERSRAGGQMNLWGGDKAIITGNVSNPRLHSTASAEKTFTQLVEQNLVRNESAFALPAQLVHTLANTSPFPPTAVLQADTHTRALSAEISL